MAMEMILTHRNLRDFIIMAHRYLYKVPENRDDASRINSYFALVDQINALLWHDTSEFHEDDKPEDSVQIISNHMKKKLQDRFFRQENRYKGATEGWEDPECFAECCMDIWTSFIPGYWDLNSLTNRPRGKQLDQFYVEPRRLRFNTHIAQQLRNIADLMMEYGAYNVRIDHLTRVFCDMVSPDAANGLADCLYEIIQSDEDVDESMLDEYVSNESQLLEVLHEKRDNEFVSDRIYQIASALCQMAITDSMIVNASFKLGEWWTEKQTPDAPKDDPGTIAEAVFDPVTGRINKFQGTIAAGVPIAIPTTHIFVSVNRDLIYSKVRNIIANVTAEEPEVSFPLDEDTLRRILRESAKAIHPDIGVHEATVLEDYLLNYISGPTKLVDINTLPEELPDIAADLITCAIMGLLPKSMQLMYSADGKTYGYDLSTCKYICNVICAYIRKAISTAYMAREMGTFNPEYTINPRNIYEDFAAEIVSNMLQMVYDVPGIKELVELWFKSEDYDPLNMDADVLFDIFRLCIPTCGPTEEKEIENVPDPKPAVNFPKPKKPEYVKNPINAVSYNFIYHVNDITVDRFALAPANIISIINHFAEMPVESPVVDDALIRYLFPHVDPIIRKEIRKGYRSLYDALKSDAYLGDESRSEYMWLALSILIPKWGYPNGHWNLMDAKRKIYDMSMDEINRSTSVVTRNIFTAFGV